MPIGPPDPQASQAAWGAGGGGGVDETPEFSTGSLPAAASNESSIPHRISRLAYFRSSPENARPSVNHRHPYSRHPPLRVRFARFQNILAEFRRRRNPGRRPAFRATLSAPPSMPGLPGTHPLPSVPPSLFRTDRPGKLFRWIRLTRTSTCFGGVYYTLSCK